MDSQVLEPKKQELEDFIQGNPDAREVKRALAVKWSLSGISYRQIRKLLNVSLGFISKWNKNFSTWGGNGLKIAYKGKPSYLSQSDKEEILLWLSHKEMWDLTELAREHPNFAKSKNIKLQIHHSSRHNAVVTFEKYFQLSTVHLKFLAFYLSA